MELGLSAIAEIDPLSDKWEKSGMIDYRFSIAHS